MSERRAVAESALRHLCERIGVEYTTETERKPDAWFLETITRARVNIMQWAGEDNYGLSHPLGGYGLNLSHEEVYDRCWFADRCFTARHGHEPERHRVDV
jgi:hypothetical protein